MDKIPVMTSGCRNLTVTREARCDLQQQRRAWTMTGNGLKLGVNFLVIKMGLIQFWNV